MESVLARINEWQRTGLLDAATADRLRAAEGAQLTATASATGDGGREAPRTTATSASETFGPSPTITEMFSYLGVAFLLGSWTAFIARLVGDGSRVVAVTAGLLIAAIVLGAVGLILRRGDARRRRAAGMAFLATILYATGAAAGLISDLNLAGSAQALILATVAVAVATVGRRLHAALLTQFGLIASATAFGGLFLAWLRDVVAPANFNESGQPIGSQPDPLIMIAVSAGVWLLVAVGLGLLALRETADRSADAAAAVRRAALTRIWAGIVAIGGLASSLSRSDLLSNGDYGRIVAPWIMDVILLGVAAVLLERAFRRDSAAYLLAAGLGLITALTDINFSYLSSASDVGLLIEGALLLAVGFAADRLRRRLPGGRSTIGPPDPGPAIAALG